MDFFLRLGSTGDIHPSSLKQLGFHSESVVRKWSRAWRGIVRGLKSRYFFLNLNIYLYINVEPREALSQWYMHFQYSTTLNIHGRIFFVIYFLPRPCIRMSNFFWSFKSKREIHKREFASGSNEGLPQGTRVLAPPGIGFENHFFHTKSRFTLHSHNYILLLRFMIEPRASVGISTKKPHWKLHREIQLCNLF